MKKGKLIVFDGNDGSGKQTQAGKLIDRLKKGGSQVQTIDFPRYYDNFFGAMVGRALTGDYGDFLSLDPHIASLLYAADRFESSEKIKDWLEKGYIVITDRYVSANQIHQGGKIDDVKERHEFIGWLHEMEYEVFGIPKPDAVFYLDVPAEVSLKNLKEKKVKYSEGKTDQHEASETFLINSRRCALWMVEQNKSWHLIECVKGKEMRSVDDIHEEVYKKLKELS